MRLTNSELQTYKRCKRKWWLSHERRLAPRIPKVTGALALGDRVHKALLVRYKGERWEDELRRLHDRDASLLRSAANLIDDGEGAVFVASQLEQLTKDHELAVLMLEGYEQWVEEEGIDSDLQIYDLECTIETPLFGEDDDVTLLGKLDQRAYRQWDDARVFRDFKTTGNLTEPAKTLPRDEQALTYMCLEHATAARSGAEITGHFDAALFTLIRKVKRTARATPPFYGQIEVRHPIHELRRFWLRLKEEARELLRLRQRIGSGENPAIVAYPSPRRDCTFDCPFYQVCPMFDNGDDAEGYILEHFEERDPLARYYDEEADA